MLHFVVCSHGDVGYIRLFLFRTEEEWVFEPSCNVSDRCHAMAYYQFAIRFIRQVGGAERKLYSSPPGHTWRSIRR
jgi:hypothetical protein